jgi:hypothetical protein
LNKAARVAFIGKDKNRISEAMNFQFYLSEEGDPFNIEKSVFIGECFVPWKSALTNNAGWVMMRAALTDPMGKC